MAYLVAFLLALGLDQPFGPVLVAVLLAGAAITAYWIRTLTRFRFGKAHSHPNRHDPGRTL